MIGLFKRNEVKEIFLSFSKRESNFLTTLLGNLILLIMALMVTIIFYFILNLILGTGTLLRLDAENIETSYLIEDKITVGFKSDQKNNTLTIETKLKEETFSIIEIESNQRGIYLKSDNAEEISILEVNRKLGLAVVEVVQGPDPKTLKAVIEEILREGVRTGNPGLLGNQKKLIVRFIDEQLKKLGLYKKIKRSNAIRFINGRVQFFTVLFFVLLLVILLASRLWVVVLGEYQVKAIYGRLTNIAEQGDQPNQKILTYRRFLKSSKHTFSAKQNISPLITLFKHIQDFNFQRASLAQLPSSISALANNLLRSLEAAYQLPRYLQWSIPLIGFIGTILGISQSMSAAGGVSSTNRFEQIIARNQVTSNISVAFDTTLLALILSLIGALALNLILRAEKELILDAEVEAIKVALELEQSESKNSS